MSVSIACGIAREPSPCEGEVVFSPCQVVGYGTYGQETARKIAKVLEKHSLQIVYKKGIFTVRESSAVSKEGLEAILAEINYHAWKPKVLDEVDQCGNRLVQLCSALHIHKRYLRPTWSNGYIPQINR